MPRIGFGKWNPDLPPLALGAKGVLLAQNVIPRKVGYGPMKSLLNAGLGTMNERARGSIWANDNAGNYSNFGATLDKLYRLSAAGFVDVSKAGGYSITFEDTWQMVRFDEDVIAMANGENIQFFNLVTSGLFADLAAAAPQARHGAIIRQHLVVGNTWDVAAGAKPERVWWPATGNPFSWPTPGTDAAAAVQSDYRDLQGDGGQVMGIVGGAEVGVIFQERAIHRMDYVGGDVIYEIVEVENDSPLGLYAPRMAIPTGKREILFLDQSGWHLFDYTRSIPAGEERINRWFLDDMVPEYRERMSFAVDPNSPLIYIGYTGAGHSGGTPNKVLIYNWATDAFSTASVVHEQLCQVAEIGSFETMDSLPDYSIDASTGSFDETAGRLLLGGWDSTHRFSKFNGATLAGLIQTGDMEAFPGRWSRVKSARGLFEGESLQALCQISERAKSGDPIVYNLTQIANANGEWDFRSEGRYHRFQIVLAGDFDHFYALDVDAAPSGMR